MSDKIRELWEYATDDNVNKEEQKEVEKGALAFMTSLGYIDTANKIAATFFYTGAILAMQSAQAEIERLKCCGNCKHNGMQPNGPCPRCTRSGMPDVVKDRWEPNNATL